MDSQHIIELVIMAVVNGGATFASIRAHLKAIDRRLDEMNLRHDRSDSRIDKLYSEQNK